MKIEVINIADLKPLEKNVRMHNEKQINELVRSLNQFGQTRAVVVDEENNILIGNGLYYALKTKGETTADCYRVTGLTETQKKKLVLTDNKVFSLGRDDFETIQDFINDITIEGDFDIAGFDDEVIRAMSRELDEITTDISNYGKIPDNYIQPKNEVLSAPQQVSQPTEVIDTTSTYNVPQSAPQSVYEQPAQTIAEVKNDRTIICPSCGEVIHID